MEPLVIRDAESRDIEGMLPLLKQLFSIEADFCFDRDVQARGLAMMLDGCGKHRAVKVAVQNERIVGMCTAQTRISTARGAVCATVEDLVVDGAFRGRSVGSQLLDAVQAWADQKGIAALSLLADKNNTAGLSFYKGRAWDSTDLICLVKSV